MLPQVSSPYRRSGFNELKYYTSIYGCCQFILWKLLSSQSTHPQSYRLYQYGLHQVVFFLISQLSPTFHPPAHASKDFLAGSHAHLLAFVLCLYRQTNEIHIHLHQAFVQPQSVNQEMGSGTISNNSGVGDKVSILSWVLESTPSKTALERRFCFDPCRSGLYYFLSVSPCPLFGILSTSEVLG